MSVQERFYTTADLLAMPDDGRRYELENGDLITTNPPVLKHAILSMRFISVLLDYNKVHDAGMLTGSDGGYRLYADPITGRETVYIPDVAFVTKARITKLLNDIYPGAPDLAVEIISPSETVGMINRKLRGYFKYGTRLVWLVYGDARIVEVYTSAEQFTTLTV